MAVEALVWDQLVGLNIDQDIFTASPNNTINCVQIAAIGSGTNIGLALSPKGTGYISAQVPDGTAAGGNARGVNAVDLQIARGVASAVASGANSGIFCGNANAATGQNAAVLCGQQSVSSGSRSVVVNGVTNAASGADAIVGGSSCTASGSSSVSFGAANIASGESSICLGANLRSSASGSVAFGNSGRSHRPGMMAFAGSGFATAGDGQAFLQVLLIKTTDATETELKPRGALTGDRMVLLANTLIYATILISGVKSDGSVYAAYARKVVIKRVANTTTLESLQVMETDVANGTAISVTADDVNDSLRVAVTGIAGETWRWVAVIDGAELGIGA